MKYNMTQEQFQKWYTNMMYQYLYQQKILNKQAEKKKKRNKRTILNVSGEWESNWGKMYVQQIGNKVTATYGWDTGKFEGTLEGTILKGYWSEATTYECPRDKGPLEFEFTPDGNSLNGKWGYCNEEMNGSWTGTKIGPVSIGINVTGSWKIYDGIMLLEQNGNEVIGTYEGISFIGGANEGKLKGMIAQDPNTKLFVFNGVWYEPPTFECPGDKGKLKMIFNQAQNQFKANWGYCDDPIFEINAFQGDLIVGPDPLNISGLWNTSIGSMTFTQNGSSITATYKDGKARLDGKINGNVLIGNWYEAETYSCPYNKGKYKMIFDATGKTFKAIWDYCEFEPDPAKVWNGVKA